MIRDNCEYRSFSIEADKKDDKQEYRVSGYASTFEPYVLYTDDEGHNYSERIEPTAFDSADLSDVVFLYNHEGMVYARQKNGTLNLSIDAHGLKVEADLSSTEQSRSMYDQISSGLIDQMSFAFVVEDDEYDRVTRTRTIKRLGKIYDVSAVSMAANPGTDISAVSARDYFHGVIEIEKAERLEEQRQLALAKAKFNFMEV